MDRKFNDLSKVEQKDILVRLGIFSTSYEELETIFKVVNPVLQENNTFDSATSTRLLTEMLKRA